MVARASAACQWSAASVLLLVGAALRVLLVVAGEALDARGVAYSDLDYTVFREGAREAWRGGSPFDRATFRYTPLLAWALVPTLWLPAAGKYLFCAADVLIAALSLRILRARGVGARAAAAFAALFLLHPFAVNVSTRGNADSIVCALVLAVLHCLLGGARAVDGAALAFGLAVHTKVYPVIYALPLLLFLDAHFAPADFAAGDDDAADAAVLLPPAESALAAAAVADDAPLAGDASRGGGSVRRGRSASRRRRPGPRDDAAAHDDASATPQKTAAVEPVKRLSRQLGAMAPAGSAPLDDGSRLCLALGAPLSACLRLCLRLAAWPCGACVELLLGGGAATAAHAAAASTAVGSAAWSDPASWPWRPPSQLLAVVRGGRGVLAAACVHCGLRPLRAAFAFATPRRCGFGALSLLTFGAVTAACWAAYGWPFLWETYLYHLVRTDNRHNFSPYFYDLYLRYDDPASRAGVGLLALLPQFGTLAALGAAFYRDLPMALFLQSFVFVVWNKVITVQVRRSAPPLSLPRISARMPLAPLDCPYPPPPVSPPAFAVLSLVPRARATRAAAVAAGCGRGAA